MDQNTLYRDIAGRCGGDIYMGVVGPVRTGKSTFIKRFMELLVLPNIKDEHSRERTTDEMPQSGAGRTIMTTQPKFVPNEAVEIRLRDGAQARVRLVDCVGYLIPGVLGLNEDGDARMVRTPWYDHDIPFEEAAEVGTRRVIREHATIGVVVTTDGSAVDMPRSAYLESEERVVRELKALGKPFVLVLNARMPDSPDVQRLRDALENQYAVPVIAVDVQNMDIEDVNGILESLLFEFPLREIRVQAPSWLTSLSEDHWLGKSVSECVEKAVADMHRVREHLRLKAALEENEYAEAVTPVSIDLNAGSLEYRLDLRDGLFYRILGEASGQEIQGEEHLFELMKNLVAAKREYDRVASALESVRSTGYGIVEPAMDELALEAPELVKQGAHFGVRMKAKAPSVHMVRVDVKTEVNPIVGPEAQSRELVRALKEKFDSDTAAVWDTEIFGRSLYDIVRDGMYTKLGRMPDEARAKLRQSLESIINDGSGGMICILL